jgi:NAD(P)-dependent dehydrogenase (short-subunit alcohol dehydrogenase family)
VVDATVLVTGGTGGLGGAVTESFLAAGWRVVVPTREPMEDETVQREGAELVPADLLEPDSVAEVVGVAADGPVPLRAVVNLVGAFAGGPRVHETEPGDLDRLLTVNLRPTFLVTRAALPRLMDVGGGALVYVSARAAVQPFAGAAGYSTAKAAVLAFAQAVAVEYRRDGIRANTILPSVIDTPANRAAMPNADHSRWVPPAQIAGVIRFLCSEESAPTSGAAVPVYGRA